MRRFEQAVQAALDGIPAEFQPYLEDIEFIVAERPPADARSGPDAGADEVMFGLYDGAGALESGGMPARVTVFKAPHEAVCESWDELVEEVRRTVLHEVGHHFLMEEGELPY